jgi:DivIVA domain-containing protein
VVTVLEYLVIAAAIGLVVFVLAVFVFGRGEQMAPLSPRISPSELPDGAIAGEDVRQIRFSLALRGYRMSDVDWTLDRLSDELDRLHRRVAELGGEPVPSGVPPRAVEEDLFGDEEPELVRVGGRPAPAAGGQPAAAPPSLGSPAVAASGRIRADQANPFGTSTLLQAPGAGTASAETASAGTETAGTGVVGIESAESGRDSPAGSGPAPV